MKNYLKKIIEVEEKMAIELGEFNLFALFEREDIKDKWDIIISINIPISKKNEIIKKIHLELKANLPESIMFKFSRFVFLEPSNPFVQNINMLVRNKHNDAEFRDCSVNNIKIMHAYIISSQKM